MEVEPEAEAVAFVSEMNSTEDLSNLQRQVETICNEKCNLRAIIDTGSPVSFVKYDIYVKWILSFGKKLEPSRRIFVNMEKTPLDIVGVVPVDLTIDLLKNKKVVVKLFVITSNVFDSDFIFGREFMRQQGLTLCCPNRDEAEIEPEPSENLSSELPLCVEEESEKLDSVLDNYVIDFGDGNKKRLREIILSIGNKIFEPVGGGCAVRADIKENSVFAFAPRRRRRTLRAKGVAIAGTFGNE